MSVAEPWMREAPAFVAGVIADGLGPSSDAEERARLTASLAGAGYELAPDGWIRRDGIALGQYGWLSRDDAEMRFHGAPWMPLDPECPFLGRIALYFAWTLYAAQESERAEFGSGLACFGRAGIVRLATGEVVYPVRLLRFDATSMLLRHGFGDGGALLGIGGIIAIPDRDGYKRDLLERARRTLERAGLALHPMLKDTHHNPLRVSLPNGPGAVSEAAAERALHDHDLELWAFDEAGISNTAFWSE